MLRDDDRLIIILGMAHSGTTILTYVLQQHPDILCYASGSESHLLENSWLPRKQIAPIQSLLYQWTQKRLLLKRPWLESSHGDWLKSEMFHARFVYCYRDFADISVSWSKPTSNVGDDLRSVGLDVQKQRYDNCFEQAMYFGSGVPFFYQHYHPDFLQNPRKTINDLTEWLGLRPFHYDVSTVSNQINIKKVISLVRKTDRKPRVRFIRRKPR